LDGEGVVIEILEYAALFDTEGHLLDAGFGHEADDFFEVG
jgi:hypothetical protein